MIGLIAGLALGIRTETDGLVLSLLLGLVGAIWFAIAFLIGHVLPEHSCASWNAWAGFAGCSPWNGWAGAIGGTLFGTTFAMYDKSKRSQKLSKFTHKRTG
jgi:membrane associated rhomboid family serine protease